MLLVSASARAHQDPAGCSQTGVAITLSLFRADGTTGVVGTVSECETIIYQARLAKSQDISTICAFSGAPFSLTTPDGVNHVISANVPCIGGDGLGEGCDSTRDVLDSAPIPYTVRTQDIVGGIITATSQYGIGVVHDNTPNTPGAQATTPKATSVTICQDNDLCTENVCDPNASGPAACSFPPVVCPDNDLCTTVECNPANGMCETTNTVNCDDNDLCTTKACNPANGMCEIVSTVQCEDNNLCITNECIPSSGECETTGEVMCNDNDPCTDDVCNPETGECESTPNNNPECVGERHFQCYEIKPFAFARRSASVEDRFGDGTVTVRAPSALCAPSDKNGEDPSAPDDPEHLANFPVTGAAPQAQNIVVTDQFGTVQVDLVRRSSLLVPTAKGLATPPGPLVNPVIDHFQCYRVRRSPGTPRFSPITGVAATDQFGAHGLDLLRIRSLCVPANKNDEDPNAPLSPQALLCYKTRQRVRFGELTPFINDQFVAQQVRLIRRIEFCVPATLEDLD
jgi:hypothetical protein